MTQYNETFRSYLDRAISPHLIAISKQNVDAVDLISKLNEDIQNSEEKMYSTYEEYVKLKDQMIELEKTTEGYKNETFSLYTELTHIWLGERDSDPTQNDDGSDLKEGAAYYNSETKIIRIYTKDPKDGKLKWLDSDLDAQNILTTITTMTNNVESRYNEICQIRDDIKNWFNSYMPSSGDANKFVIVNTDGSGFAYKTPQESLDWMGGAPLVSPRFSGNVIYDRYESNSDSIPDNTLVNASMVKSFASNDNPLMDGNVWGGDTNKFSRSNHVHPIDSSRAPVTSPVFNGFARYNRSVSNNAVSSDGAEIATYGSIRDFSGNSPPTMNGIASGGNSPYFSRENHVHPQDSSKADINGNNNVTFNASTFYSHNYNCDGNNPSVAFKNNNSTYLSTSNMSGYVFLDLQSNVINLTSDWLGGTAGTFFWTNYQKQDTYNGFIFATGKYGSSDERIQWQQIWTDTTFSFNRLSDQKINGIYSNAYSVFKAEDKLLTIGVPTNFLSGTTGANGDNAELYKSDNNYVPGQLLMPSETKDEVITLCTNPYNVLGVYSTAPQTLINDFRSVEEIKSNTFNNCVPLALHGKVPVLVKGPVHRGKPIVADVDGTAIEKPKGDDRPHIGRSCVEDLSNGLRYVSCYVSIVI